MISCDSYLFNFKLPFLTIIQPPSVGVIGSNPSCSVKVRGEHGGFIHAVRAYLEGHPLLVAGVANSHLGVCVTRGVPTVARACATYEHAALATVVLPLKD